MRYSKTLENSQLYFFRDFNLKAQKMYLLDSCRVPQKYKNPMQGAKIFKPSLRLTLYRNEFSK